MPASWNISLRSDEGGIQQYIQYNNNNNNNGGIVLHLDAELNHMH